MLPIPHRLFCLALFLLSSLALSAAEEDAHEVAIRRVADQLGRELDGVMDTSRMTPEDKRRVLRFFAQKLLTERESARTAGLLAGMDQPRPAPVVITVRPGTYQVREVRDGGTIVILEDGSCWRPERPVSGWTKDFRVRIEPVDQGRWSLRREGSDDAFTAVPGTL